MGQVRTGYPTSYLAKHDIYSEMFGDRKEALAKAKDLRQQGYTVKVTKLNFDGDRMWTVEGNKTK